MLSLEWFLQGLRTIFTFHAHEFESFRFDDKRRNKMKQSRLATNTKVQAQAKGPTCDRQTIWDHHF